MAYSNKIGDPIVFSDSRPNRSYFLPIVKRHSLLMGVFVTLIILLATLPYTPGWTLVSISLYWLYKLSRGIVNKFTIAGASFDSEPIVFVRCIILIIAASIFIVHVYTSQGYWNGVGRYDTLWLLYILPLFILNQHSVTRLMLFVFLLSSVALIVATMIGVPQWSGALFLSIALKLVWFSLITLKLYILTRFINDRSANLRLLHDLQKAIADLRSQSKEDQLLTTVIEKIAANFRYPHAHVFELQSDGVMQMVAGVSPEARQLVARGFTVGQGKGIVGHVVETGEIYFTNDVSTDPHYVKHDVLPNTKAELAVPIKLGGKTIGVLDIQVEHTDAFVTLDKEVMEILANLLSSVLDNIKLVKSREQISQIIGSIARRLLSRDELKSTLREIVCAAYEELDADIVFLYEYNPLTGTTSLGASHGQLYTPAYLDDTIQKHYPLVDLILSGDKDFYFEENVQGAPTEPLFQQSDDSARQDIPPLVARERIRSRAALRLKADMSYVGVMFLHFRSNRKFDGQAERMFFIFADLAALAIQKALSQQQRIESERQNLIGLVHDRTLGRAFMISELISSSLEAKNLTQKQRLKLNLARDTLHKLSNDVRFVYDIWRETPSDNFCQEIEKVAQSARQAYGMNFITGFNRCDVPVPATFIIQVRLILDEVIMNAVRHANADTITLDCVFSKGLAAINIEDDGNGFDTGQVKLSGINIIKERARQMGGHCTIESIPAVGTCVSILVPITRI